MPNKDMMFSGSTQIAWACAALLSGRTIGHRQEIEEVNGHRLAAIIHKLKSRYFWPIETTYTGKEGRAQYKLNAAYDRSKLLFPPSARYLGNGRAAK